MYFASRRLLSRIRFGVRLGSVLSKHWWWILVASVESGGLNANKSKWLLDPEGMYNDSGGDDVVFGENRGFEVLEERVERLGGPPLWISTALNASTRGFASKPLRQGSVVGFCLRDRLLRLCTLAMRLY
jgi:hypothetical protein